MPKQTRDPAYDLQRHIITGERGALSGDSNLRQYDDDSIDHNDPMMFGAGSGTFTSDSAGAILSRNAAEAVNLDSARGDLGDPINMNEMAEGAMHGK
jgi:hypothetical protein